MKNDKLCALVHAAYFFIEDDEVTAHFSLQ